MKLLIKNISGLVLAEQEGSEKPLYKGAEMAQIPIIENAWLAVENGKIADFGSMEEFGGIVDWRDLEVIDATGKFIAPAFCDSHTHLVFAAPREQEFVDRTKGLSYEEIAARGGGILNSAAKMATMPENQLFEQAKQRLKEAIGLGTGAIEIKSGYGLDLETELKMLRVIARVKAESEVAIKATFLGAHAYPVAYKNNHDGYVDLIINEMLPAIAAENLADYIDVFCERNYFEVAATARIMEAGAKYGLKAKIHVNQFSSSGGVAKAIELGALSVDHLEVLTDEEIALLSASSTLPVLLPACSLFIKIPYGPARKLIDAGCAVVLASDFNPGSAPTCNMSLVNSLATINMNMLPEEVLAASTINGAHAMDLSTTHGSIAVGKAANFILTKAMPSLAYWPYSFGSNQIEKVFINGKLQA